MSDRSAKRPELKARCGERRQQKGRRRRERRKMCLAQRRNRKRNRANKKCAAMVNPSTNANDINSERLIMDHPAKTYVTCESSESRHNETNENARCAHGSINILCFSKIRTRLMTKIKGEMSCGTYLFTALAPLAAVLRRSAHNYFMRSLGSLPELRRTSKWLICFQFGPTSRPNRRVISSMDRIAPNFRAPRRPTRRFNELLDCSRAFPAKRVNDMRSLHTRDGRSEPTRAESDRNLRSRQSGSSACVCAELRAYEDVKFDL